MGSRALAVLQSDFFISANADWVLRLLQWSFGYVVPLLVCAGLINAFATRGEIGAAIAAGLCLVIGVWFWIVVTGLSQVRYFLPFGVMAFIVVEPSLLLRTRSLPSMIRIGFAAVILTPTVGVTLLLLHPQPPLAWQRLLNVNLSSALFRAENQQAVDFLDTAHEEGARSVYMLELNSWSRNFVAVVEYRNFFNPSLTRTSIKLPVDWSRSTTFRLEEILSSDYVAFEPIRTDVERKAILGSRTVADFQAETRLLKAWLSTLSSAEGVALISESQLRLLRIVDRDRFVARWNDCEADTIGDRLFARPTRELVIDKRPSTKSIVWQSLIQRLCRGSMLTTKIKIRLAAILSKGVRSIRRLYGASNDIVEVVRGGMRWRLDLREGIDFSIYLLGAFEHSMFRPAAGWSGLQWLYWMSGRISVHIRCAWRSWLEIPGGSMPSSRLFMLSRNYSRISRSIPTSPHG